jgi:hypothetical protein
MATLSPLTWIGNAAAVLCGSWGDVTRQAHLAGCSRQTLYTHAARVHHAVEQLQTPTPDRLQLQQQLDQLRDENEQLWHALQDATDFGPDRQQRFTATAAALGLSLNQTHALLGCVRPFDVPSRARLGRWVQRAAAEATRVLKALDAACQTHVRLLCLDEIFCHHRATLVGVEPLSLTWVLGQRGPDRSGATWHRALQPWTRLEYVASDDGTGLQIGLERIRQDRQQAGQGPPLESNLDVFHTRREGTTALRRQWSDAEGVWEKAEAAQRQYARTQRRGQDRRADNMKTRFAWQRAEAAFFQAERYERAWKRAEAALNLFRPDGRLNDRSWAEEELRATAEVLQGTRWAKVRRMLTDPRSLTFLDRVHRELAQAEAQGPLREALVELWRLRHATRPGCGPVGRGPAGVVSEGLQALLCSRLGEDWHGAYRRVARVLEGVVRASSVVEGMNSVLRMHQSRHRLLTQALLDLKRLYWNCREFAEGKRAEACPYQHLGLALPSYDWWELLSMEEQQLKEKVSTPKRAA